MFLVRPFHLRRHAGPCGGRLFRLPLKFLLELEILGPRNGLPDRGLLLDEPFDLPAANWGRVDREKRDEAVSQQHATRTGTKMFHNAVGQSAVLSLAEMVVSQMGETPSPPITASWIVVAARPAKATSNRCLPLVSTSVA